MPSDLYKIVSFTSCFSFLGLACGLLNSISQMDRFIEITVKSKFMQLDAECLNLFCQLHPILLLIISGSRDSSASVDLASEEREQKIMKPIHRLYVIFASLDSHFQITENENSYYYIAYNGTGLQLTYLVVQCTLRLQHTPFHWNQGWSPHWRFDLIKQAHLIEVLTQQLNSAISKFRISRNYVIQRVCILNIPANISGPHLRDIIDAAFNIESLSNFLPSFLWTSSNNLCCGRLDRVSSSSYTITHVLEYLFLKKLPYESKNDHFRKV